jgi:hypothetical protein
VIPDQVDDFHFLRCELALEEARARSRDDREQNEVESAEKIVPDQ